MKTAPHHFGHRAGGILDKSTCVERAQTASTPRSLTRSPCGFAYTPDLAVAAGPVEFLTGTIEFLPGTIEFLSVFLSVFLSSTIDVRRAVRRDGLEDPLEANASGSVPVGLQIEDALVLCAERRTPSGVDWLRSGARRFITVTQPLCESFYRQLLHIQLPCHLDNTLFSALLDNTLV